MILANVMLPRVTFAGAASVRYPKSDTEQDRAANVSQNSDSIQDLLSGCGHRDPGKPI